jgi:hypothetical protein
MSIKTVRHRLLYLKDSLQGTIYAALSKTSWLTALSPILALVVRPLLGMTLTTLALLQLWTFSHTGNKNLDGWMTTVGSLAGAGLNNVAAFGGFIARVTGTVFVVAPWFFVAGFGVGALYQLVMAGVNLRRAYEAPTQSHQRQHYLQGAGYNLITGLQLASCATAIVLFNAFPAFGLLVTAFALTVVAINLGNCIWRFLSSETKKEIKNAIGIGKPEKDLSHESVTLLDKSNEAEQLRHTRRLFTTCDHCAVIKEMNISESKIYLDSYITKKINELVRRAPSEKNQQKITVLEQLRHIVVEDHHAPDKGKMHKKYPRVVENFWCEKSDTDQLIDAVIYYCKTVKEEQLCSKKALAMN